jgi:hypothetical protein
LKERGLFSEPHQRLVADMTQRRDQINAKLASAEAKDRLWSVIRSETERDFGSLFDDLLQLNERLDADQMKSDAAAGQQENRRSGRELLLGTSVSDFVENAAPLVES